MAKSNAVWWLLGGGAVLIVLSQVNRKVVMSNLSSEKLSENFSLSEFVVTSTGLDNLPGEVEKKRLKALVVNTLQPARNAIAKKYPGSKIVWVISSGYRSRLVNTAIGGSDTSQHMSGEASDNSVFVDGRKLPNQEVIDIIRANKIPYDQMIDEKLKGKEWVHLSFSLSKNRKQWMTARDKSGGGTLYATVMVG